MKKIILIGAGGHAKSCIDVVETEKKFRIIGLVDKKNNNNLLKYKIIGNNEDLKKIKTKADYALITVGQIKNASLREELFKRAKNYNFKFPIIISPYSYVSKHSLIGEGTIIMHMAIINANAKIGNNCIINTKSLIEHDVTIGNHVHISTGAIINGGVIIKNNSFIGSGSVIKQNVKIGENCFINANTFLDRDLKDNSKIL